MRSGRPKRTLTLVTAMVTAALLSACSSLAIDARGESLVEAGGHYAIYQYGEKVGEIYSEADPPPELTGLEHWVLSPAYVDASSRGPAALEIIPCVHPAGDEISSARDFFRRVEWGEGYRYVRVAARSSTTLPGR